ncbi:hypothetical protein EMCRGX_G015766 [Ephydatia muelleri]
MAEARSNPDEQNNTKDDPGKIQTRHILGTLKRWPLFRFLVGIFSTLNKNIPWRVPLEWLASLGLVTLKWLPDKVGSSTKTSQRFGLPNIGNSCYMNATLQCLRSTQELKDFFSDRSRFIFLHEFATVMDSMWEGQTREINLGHIKNVTTQFHGTSQQDCQEYLTAVLEKLHTALKSPPNYISCASGHSKALATQADKCWLNYLSTHGNSIVVDTFQGQLQTHLQCQQCKAVFERFDPFASIATPIPITEGKESLHICVKQLMSKESIGNWPCHACKKTVSVARSIAISKAPKVLLMHLNRFHQDVNGKRHKIETFVDFPFELDISEHCQSGDSSQPRCVYDLFAVIHHFGTISSGHYIACCKDRGSDQWQRYDDARVTVCNKDEVVKSSAYVLFYHIRDGPNRDGPNRDEPNRDEPNRNGPNRDEPNRDEPNRNEPNRDGPNRDEPNRDEPNRDEPNRNGPNRDEPNRDEPNRDGPNRDEPNRDEPRRDGPNRDEPNKNGPNRDGPNRDGPNTNEPNRDEPNRDGSNKDGPNKDGPNRDGPNRDADERLIRGKDVEHEDENLSGQNLQQLGELKSELEKKNTQIEQLQKLLDEKDKEIESLKNKLQ